MSHICVTTLSSASSVHTVSFKHGGWEAGVRAISFESMLQQHAISILGSGHVPVEFAYTGKQGVGRHRQIFCTGN